MARWETVPLEPLNQNTDETVLSRAVAAVENGYRNEGDGFSRFPGLKPWIDLPGQQTWLFRWRGDLIAVTNQGRVYRIGKSGAADDVTGVPLSGGRRPTFAATEDELLLAAGGPIVRLAKARTELLSLDAPNTTHVAFIQGYVVAIEEFSGRFFFSQPGSYRQWDPLDVFTAESKPDDLNAAVVTPYNELLLAGLDSIEQFEPFPSGVRPFARRWTTGEGLLAPYTLLPSKSGTYGVNRDQEFVRFQLQSSTDEGAAIGLQLESITDWEGAWSAEIKVKGQVFILLQIPNAETPYGTRGLTFLFDQRRRQWSTLYGWDRAMGQPARWPGWSYEHLWGRHFVGVPGGIAELDRNVYDNAGQTQRFLVRSGHVDQWGECRVDNFEIRLRRGGAGNQERRGIIGLRFNRDNRGFGKWVWRELGRQGERNMVIEWGGMGIAKTWQWEMAITDAAVGEVVGARAYIERMPR